MAVGCPSKGCRASSSISDILASAAQKMIPPADIWGAPFRKLTCGPTKLTRTKGFVNLVNINDSSCSDRTMSIQRPSCFFTLWSSCSRRPKQRRSCRLLLPPVASCAAAEASPPLLLPPLARPSLYSPTPPIIPRRRQPHTAAKPVDPRTPLRAGFNCRVFPDSASSPS